MTNVLDFTFWKRTIPLPLCCHLCWCKKKQDKKVSQRKQYAYPESFNSKYVGDYEILNNSLTSYPNIKTSEIKLFQITIWKLIFKILLTHKLVLPIFWSCLPLSSGSVLITLICCCCRRVNFIVGFGANCSSGLVTAIVNFCKMLIKAYD